MPRQRSLLFVAVAFAVAGSALGVVLSDSSADPLRTVSNQGRRVPLTAAMRRSFRESEYDVARIRLYQLAVRGPRLLYRFTTGKHHTCYGKSRDGGQDLDFYGCPWRPLGHPDQVVNASGYSGPPAEGRTAATIPQVCNSMPLEGVWGWTVDAVKAIRILDERGRIAGLVPVRSNVYSILDGQLPKHPCSLEAVDARGHVLWTSHDPPEF